MYAKVLLGQVWLENFGTSPFLVRGFSTRSSLTTDPLLLKGFQCSSSCDVLSLGSVGSSETWLPGAAGGQGWHQGRLPL